MRRLNKIETLVFLLGGILMVIGAGLYVFMIFQNIAALLFLIGAIFFATMQMKQKYDGKEVTILRLYRIQILADILFIVSGLLMLDSYYHFLYPLFSDQMQYIKYVYNKWILTILIAAILEIYTIHRISSELRK